METPTFDELDEVLCVELERGRVEGGRERERERERDRERERE